MAKQHVSTIINGEPVEYLCEPQQTLLDVLRDEAGRPEFFAGASDEDVHTLVIRKLKGRVGALADKIHTGRSRNEQVSLDVRLWLREENDRARGLLVALLEALLACARRYPDVVIPGYTHMRRAQAVLWPHYLLAYYPVPEGGEILRVHHGRENWRVS